MNFDSLLKTFGDIAAWDGSHWLHVTDSEKVNCFDLTIGDSDVMPPFRSFTGERLADIKAILAAQGYNWEKLDWYAVDEEEI